MSRDTDIGKPIEDRLDKEVAIASLEELESISEAQKVKMGEWKHVTIAKAGTISEALDIGGYFAYLQVIVPTIDSAQLELQVSESIGGTYQDLGQDALTTDDTGAFSDTWNLGGWRFIKIKASAAQNTSAVSFKVKGITY